MQCVTKCMHLNSFAQSHIAAAAQLQEDELQAINTCFCNNTYNARCLPLTQTSETKMKEHAENKHPKHDLYVSTNCLAWSFEWSPVASSPGTPTVGVNGHGDFSSLLKAWGVT